MAGVVGSFASSWPVTRATRVSAMIWATDRGSPSPRRDSARRRSAAYAATPWATGRSALRLSMVSGAGRQVTRRSAVALLVRRIAAPGSSR
jgi:hypothetical protein